MQLALTTLILTLTSSLSFFAGAFAPSSSFVKNHALRDKRSTKNSRFSSPSTSLSMALTLYGSSSSRSPLVNWAANELNLPLSPGDMNKNPHPFGQVPCLTDDNDVMVFESGAILNYLLSKSMTNEGLASNKRAAEITSWIAWANASLDPICFLETPEGRVYDTGLRSPNRRIDTLNSILSQKKYLVVSSSGEEEDQFSLADVAVASYLLYVIQFFPDVDLSARWPHVVRYMKDCASRQGYASAFGENVQGFCLQVLENMGGGDQKKKMFGIF